MSHNFKNLFDKVENIQILELRQSKKNLKLIRSRVWKEINRRHKSHIGRLRKLRDAHLIGLFSPFDHAIESLHTNFLGWLLDPRANHGLKNRFSTIFLGGITGLWGSWVVSRVNQEIPLAKNCRLDILIRCRRGEKKFIIVIENKVTSKIGDRQLERYLQEVRTRKAGNEKPLFFLLCPKKYECEPPKPWRRISYFDVAKAVLRLGSVLEDSSLINSYALGILEKLEGLELNRNGRPKNWQHLIQLFEG